MNVARARLALLAIAVAACGPPSTPPASPVQNHAPPAPITDPGCVERLSGKVIDEPTGEPLPGVTLVARTKGNADVRTVRTAISDQNGRFTLDDLAASDLLEVYYADYAAEGALPRRCDPITIAIDTRETAPGGVAPLVIR